MIKKNKIFLIIVLSIAVLATTIFQRMTIESNNKVVDVVLDYAEMNELALQSDNELKWWFSNFKDFGIKYVGLHEETLTSLVDDNKDVNIIMGWELLQNNTTKETYLSNLEKDSKEYEISKYDVLITTQSEETFNFIHDGLTSRYDKELFEVLSNEDKYTILLKGTIYDMVYLQNQSLSDVNGKGVPIKQNPYTSKLVTLGLGFDPEKIELIKASGLEVLPRPSNYRPWTTDKYIDALFKDYEDFNMVPPVFIFTGDAMLGYPDYNHIVSEYMQDNNIKVGLIESSVQRGHMDQELVEDLAKGLEYNAVRIFSMPLFIQERFKFYNYEGAEEIENTLYRAVTERNIRLIYFKPFKEDKVSFITDFEEYEKMFNRFEERIAEHGMTIGRSSVMKPNRVRIAKQALIGWGVVAAGILLLSTLFNMSKKIEYALLAIGMLLVPAAYMVKPLLMEKMMALAASIIFPSLAMTWVCKECKKHFNSNEKKYSLLNTIIIASKDLIIATAISLLGGLFVGGILSNTDFLLEMDIFRGVKISQMLPIAIYGATYIAYFGYKNKKQVENRPSLKLEDIKTLLFEDVKIIYVVLSAILLVVGYIYIARTGHETNIQPSTFEMIARNILEENLLARPRTKEFLIGFPALMVAVYFARNKYNFFAFSAGLVAVIGQASITNTFSHLRTPVYLSLARTAYALGLGIVLGAIYIIIIEICLKGLNKGLNLLMTGAEKGRN